MEKIFPKGWHNNRTWSANKIFQRRVKETKLLCYPQGVMRTETFPEIPLQARIDHTLFRLCKIQ